MKTIKTSQPFVRQTLLILTGVIPLPLGPRRTIKHQLPADHATLVAQSAPDPAGAVLNISRDDRVIVCWPTEFAGFNLQGTTNLATTNWVAIPILITNRHLEFPLLPEKYFRLIQ